MKIHITKQGESTETIASTYAVSRQDLIGINPHINLSSELVPGLKLKIPEASRAQKAPHIEKFYPNLDSNSYSKEQAVPIGMKPLESHTHDIPPAPTVEAPWSHLSENSTYLSAESMHQYPWNQSYPHFAPQDARAILPPIPYYPPYPYPPYTYPGYGYGGVVPLPVPIPGFGPGYAGGWHGGWHGGHGGWHGHGHGHGHR